MTPTSDLKLNTFYEIDWDKVKTLENLIIIFKSLCISISEENKNFQEVKPYLIIPSKQENTK